MPASSILSSLAWFVAILALIPLALWLFKRTPAGGAGLGGPLRTIANLPLGPGQRVVAVEVGRGETRRWLVLGVTAQQINTLHEMAPLEALPLEPQAVAPFSLLLQRLQQRSKDSQ